MEYSLFTIAPILLLPIMAFAIGSFIVRKFQKTAVALSTAAIIGSFLITLRIFYDFIFVKHSVSSVVHKTFTWFDLGAFKVDLGVYLDNMSVIMLLMVTGVGAIIHIFSTYYMADDKKFGQFFVYMSLFIAGMIGLVLSDNLLSLFVCWEIMGFCSYSLIGFYTEKDAAGNASIKAFMTTKIGDVFFLLGIVVLWSTIGSVTFVDIYAAIASGSLSVMTSLGISVAVLAGVSIFLGTIGKSAQFPLQVWLPDAMMGPTPCSALIHAATMVAAGVYLSLRMYPLLDFAGLTTFVAYVGAVTAFLAATMALVQTDIKAVLAYSTISQLGYMVLGVGVGSYNAAFMHLIAHAIFKACLFLSAGSVIHSIHTQEMPQMGGLRKKLPLTFIAMLVCSFAISGVPFFSGYVSKDRILGDALVSALASKTLLPVAILGYGAAFLTAFYMFRMMFLTFFGKPRDQHIYDHAHKEKFSINQNFPLLILASLSLGVLYSGSLTGQGIVNVFGGMTEWFSHLVVAPLLTVNHTEHHLHFIHSVHVVGAIVSIFIAAAGVTLAYLFYIKKSFSPAWWTTTFSKYTAVLKNKYYFDDFYIKVVIQKLLFGLNKVLAFIDMGIYDRFLIDGWSTVIKVWYRVVGSFDNLFVDKLAVDGTGKSIKAFNVVLRTVQNGKVQTYIVVAVFVLASYIWKLA